MKSLRQTDRSQLHSIDRSPQPEESGPVLACRNENGPGWREAGIDGEEINQRHPRSDYDADAVAGDGHNEEGKGEEGVEQLYPSPSTPSILHDRESDST